MSYSRILFLYAAPQRSELNKSLQNKIKDFLNAHQKTFKFLDVFSLKLDCYREGSNEYFAEIAASQDLVKWADLIILQFPVWWYAVPGKFKVWFDLVMANNFAYQTGGERSKPLLEGKKIVIISTVGSDKNALLYGQKLPDIDELLKPIILSFKFTGIENLENLFFYNCNKINKERFIEISNRLKKFLNFILK